MTKCSSIGCAIQSSPTNKLCFRKIPVLTIIHMIRNIRRVEELPKYSGYYIYISCKHFQFPIKYHGKVQIIKSVHFYYYIRFLINFFY